MSKNELNVEDLVFNEDRSESEYLELPLSRQTFFLVTAAVFIIGFLALGRMLFLNLFKGEFYQARASVNANKEVELPAPRGIIFDRYGKQLVENKSSFSVFLNIAEILKSNENFNKAINILSSTLDISEEEFRKKIETADFEKRNFTPIARNISVNQAITFKGLALPFLQVTDDYIRYYPDGPVFSHLLGYVGVSEDSDDLSGRSGIEAEYDLILKGKDGSLILFRDAAGRSLEEKIAKQPVSGSPMKTTIDAGLQKYFYEQMRNGLASLGRDSGVGMAMNPQTGEILALISFPSFDNNKVANYLKSSSQPLFNRAISGVYTPGSSIKPLMALAALHEKVVTPESRVFSAGAIEIPNPYDPEKPSRFLDWKAHGWVDVHSALAKSSNIYFYALGGGLPKNELGIASNFNGLRGLGIDKLIEYWKKFLFGKKTGIDLPGESNGFLPNPEEKEKRTGQIWRIGDTYNVSIGQGDLLLTPLQLINFTSSIANGGKIYRPVIVKRDGQPEVLSDYSEWREEIKEVQRGMIDAVEKYYGTANLLSSLPFSAAGKTGSSQVANNTRTNAFFVGYAPAEDAEIAVLVLIENSREGSLNAVPIAKDVLEWYYLNRL